MKPYAPTLVVFGLAAKACLLPSELDGSSIRARQVNDGKKPNPTPSIQLLAISDRDRFEGGKSAPQGMGNNGSSNVGPILNVQEVQSGLKGLASTFSDVKTFEAPFKTSENRTVHGAAFGDKPRVFIQSGIHARERGGPDHLLYFVGDLLRARDGKTGVAYGNKSYSAEDVNKALSVGLVFVPLVNPDGVVFDQQSSSCWRKNRNQERFNGNNLSIGVDLNRNFAVGWEVTRLLHPDARDAAGSDDPADEVYHGKGPLSEPETRNIDWVMDQHDQVSWFVDVHSFSGLVLYSWADDDAQSTDPGQNFNNTEFDGKRGLVGDEDPSNIYGEFLEDTALEAQKSLATRMSANMNLAGNVTYKQLAAASLYTTGGTSTDHAMGKCHGQPGCRPRRIQGLTIEFGAESGAECPFYPDQGQYRNSMQQVGAGLMEVMLAASSNVSKDGPLACNGKVAV